MATASTDSGLAFSLLGPLEVRRHGARLPLGGRQQRAVLAMLALEANRAVSLDRLADAIWADRTPDGSVTTLHTYAFHLREALEPDRPRGAAAQVLVTEGGGYCLRVEPASIDAAVFERRVHAGRALLEAGRPADASAELAAALSLWRGYPLLDLADYAFAQVAAARLDEMRLGAIEARVEADLALGRHGALVSELDRLAHEYPLREGIHGQRMLALYRTGRQADALAAYEELRHVLTEELGIDPSPPLQRLQAAVLSQSPSVDWQPIPMPRNPTTPASISPDADERRPRLRRPRVVLAVALVGAVIAAASVVVVDRWGVSRSSTLPANSVGSLDAHGGAHGAVGVGPAPDGVAFGAGSLWVVSTANKTVSRVDPRRHIVIQTIPVGAAPNAIAFIDGDVWVVNGGDGTVSQINPASQTEVGTIPVGSLPDAIAGGPSGVWVANSGDDTIQRIDPSSGKPDPAIQVGDKPDGIAVGAGTVWVANGGDDTVSAVDLSTGSVGSPILVGAGPRGVAVTQDAVWVTNALDLTVSRIDPLTPRVVATVPVGDGPRSIVADSTAAWVSDEYDGTVTRIDARTNTVVRRTSVGSSPKGLALVGAVPWVATGPFDSTSHVGGALNVDIAGSLPGGSSIDPAIAYGSAEENLIYDGLVALRRTAGTAGGTLVPDLATRLPHPTDGGRTYTFTLRAGIRYSNGAVVRPADISRGVQRALALNAGDGLLFASIVGGQNCIDHPTRCDLSGGVLTDDATNSVTFHLAAADPDFLYKLTVFAYATAPGAPAAETRVPLPGTGPYMIDSSFKRGKVFRLVRNPYFHQWSRAAQPSGYPDVITWHQVTDDAVAVADVVAGRADLVSYLSGAAVSELARQYPTRLFSDAWPSTWFMTLNTTLPPFNDPRVRQALNYAVDRDKLVALNGGSKAVTLSCQILPPAFPGYQPYCPYTINAGDGSYHGPDLPKARKLIEESGTAGMRIALWTQKSGDTDNKYFAGLLRELGYQVSSHELADDDYFPYVTDSRNQVQIGHEGWIADFPASSNFFTPMLSCASFVPASAANENTSAYCDPAVDQLAEQALAAQTTDRATARRLWAEVDKLVTDEAPFVPIYSPNRTSFVSTRLGNYQDNPLIGPLFDQMWVQ